MCVHTPQLQNFFFLSFHPPSPPPPPPHKVVPVTPPDVPNKVDATGAGDAFLGGVIAGLYAKGLPHTVEDLR